MANPPQETWSTKDSTRRETRKSDTGLLLEKGKIAGLKVLEFQDEVARRLNRKVDVAATTGASERFLSKNRKDEVVLYVAS